jgi:hypothetical protein
MGEPSKPALSMDLLSTDLCRSRCDHFYRSQHYIMLCFFDSCQFVLSVDILPYFGPILGGLIYYISRF